MGKRRLEHKIIRNGQGEEAIWKNGQGKSWTIGRSDGSDGQNSDWSVSIAAMKDEREFSSYPGIDRTLSIINGDGMQLRLGDREVVLTMESQPFAFDGEAQVVGDVLSGLPVLDFNVLTRRSACSQSSERVHVTKEHAVSGDADILIAYVQATSGGLHIDSIDEKLDTGDTVIIEMDRLEAVSIKGDGVLLISQVRRH